MIHYGEMETEIERDGPTLGDYLREMRTKRGFTLMAFGARVDIAWTSIKDAESGRYKLPKAYIRKLLPHLMPEERARVIALYAAAAAADLLEGL